MYMTTALIVVALLGVVGLLALAISTNAKVVRIGELVFHACLVVVLLALVLWHGR